MSTQKFVVRLLTEEGELLGWCEEHLKPETNRSEGNTRFRTPASMFQIVAAGTAKYIAIHWCDLDIARKVEMFGGPMEIPSGHIGRQAQLTWMASVWGIQGNTDVPLPPVAVGDVVLGPPPAVVGGSV